MKVLSIEYPTKWQDKFNDNIDVFVTLENGKTYCITVASLGWIAERVKKNGYREPSVDLIVSEFDDDMIRRAVEEFAADDAYWLRLYSVSYGDDIPG